jgi:hypothetical protein
MTELRHGHPRWGFPLGEFSCSEQVARRGPCTLKSKHMLPFYNKTCRCPIFKTCFETHVTILKRINVSSKTFETLNMKRFMLKHVSNETFVSKRFKRFKFYKPDTCFTATCFMVMHETCFMCQNWDKLPFYVIRFTGKHVSCDMQNMSQNV